MINQIKDLFRRMNEEGVYLPMFRDHGRPSVSLTLLVISSIFVMLGLLSSIFPKLEINFWQALSWYVTNLVIYRNRGAKIGKDGIEITGGKPNNGDN